MKLLPVLALTALLMSDCSQKNETPEKLPVLGTPILVNGDSVYPGIAPFVFLDQDSNEIKNETFADKIYVADFIFLSCATICPKMNMEMLKVYKAFETDNRVMFLSHTIDPVNDSIPRLKAFAGSLGVSSSKWHFVTGPVDSVYSLAEKSYFTAVYPDSADKSNYIHGGGLLLVDEKKMIRGVYDGTNSTETERLVKDIKTLLKE